jgi:hypothetical protein
VAEENGNFGGDGETKVRGIAEGGLETAGIELERIPFQEFDLSTNFHQYLKMFDEILAYKFDHFIGGHLSDSAKNDLQ